MMEAFIGSTLARSHPHRTGLVASLKIAAEIPLPACAQFPQAKLFRPSTRGLCGAGGLLRKGQARNPPPFCAAARRTARRRPTAIAQNGGEGRSTLRLVRYAWSIATRNHLPPVLLQGGCRSTVRLSGQQVVSRGRRVSHKWFPASRESWKSQHLRPNPRRTIPRSHALFRLAQPSTPNSPEHQGFRWSHSSEWSRVFARSAIGWGSLVFFEYCGPPAVAPDLSPGRKGSCPSSSLLHRTILE